MEIVRGLAMPTNVEGVVVALLGVLGPHCSVSSVVNAQTKFSRSSELSFRNFRTWRLSERSRLHAWRLRLIWNQTQAVRLLSHLATFRAKPSSNQETTQNPRNNLKRSSNQPFRNTILCFINYRPRQTG